MPPSAQPGEVLVEGVLDLLAREVLRPAEHQAGEEAGGLGLALEVLGRAVVQAQVHVDGVAARLLGQKGELHPLDRLGLLHAGLDGQRRDVERFALRTAPRGPCSPRRAWRRRASEGRACALACRWG